jgi:hypothetical protein
MNVALQHFARLWPIDSRIAARTGDESFFAASRLRMFSVDRDTLLKWMVFSHS